eukprot:TRINITY_DN3656_c0_g1_i1.p1 TRINITY_DN3656_c0_g1~~TRINITY_DN3656_c0_g1_i1.p1  ORF type:complete len:416 (-),score=53.34 TRINITY_DN3656_c0_g1_i1:69-1316(-)
MTFKDMVQHNVLTGMKELAICAREKGVHNEQIMHLLRFFAEIEPLELPWNRDRSLPEKIKHLWEDPAVQEVYRSLGYTKYKRGEHAKEEERKLQAHLTKKPKGGASLDDLKAKSARRAKKASKGGGAEGLDKKDTSSIPESSSHQDSHLDEELVVSRKKKKDLYPFRSHDSSSHSHEHDSDGSRPRLPDLVIETSSTAFVQNLSYFLAHLERVAAADYEPTLMDILKVRQRTTGVKLTRFVQDTAEYELVDVGGQSPERLKWETITETVHPSAILFFVSMDEFDIISDEDSTKSKLDKALEVFNGFFGTMSEEALREVTVVLFLNKRDLFEERIKNLESLERFRLRFGEGEGAEGCELILKDYVVEQASTLFDEDKEIHCHITCALDTEAMKAVFEAVKQDIFMNRLIGCRTNIV